MKISAKMRILGTVYPYFPIVTITHKLFSKQLMRIGFITSISLLITFQTLLAITTRGQDMRKDKITVGFSGESLVSGLKKIEQQTTLRFYYRKSEIKAIKLIHLPVAPRTIEETLLKMLSNTFFTFRQLEGNILIERQQQKQNFQLKGRVVNLNRTPIQSANIILKKTNSDQILAKAQSDQDGYFNLSVAEKGDYLVELTSIGMDASSITVSLSDIQVVELPEVVLHTAVTGLKEVTIISKKPLIETKLDRMIYNVENSISARGMSGMDALRSAPLIRVQDNEISIVGKSGVAIMVNDRMLNLSGSDLANYLQSLRSDDIARIEIITTPPAKYDAQGNSGIINIILKKNPNLGWSGTVGSSYQRNTKNGFQNNSTLNYQANKVSSSLRIRHFDVGFTPVGSRDLINEPYQILTTSKRNDNTYGIGLNYSIDYKLSLKSNIGLIYDHGETKYNMNSDNRSNYFFQYKIDSTLSTYAEHRWVTPTHTLNTYYELKLDTLGKKMSITGNYLSNVPDKANNFNTINSTTNDRSIVRNLSRMNYQIYAIQADFTLPFHWSNVETGVKYTLFDNNSDVTYDDYNGIHYVRNPNNSNQFVYQEKNYAAYLSMQKDLNKKLSTSIGFRYEFTQLEGLDPNQSSTLSKNNYGKIFPSAYISYKPNEIHTFSLNYSKRIDRPGFQSLNPFRWYTNPYMYYTGNSALQPSLNENIEFSYAFKSSLTASLYSQYTRNGYNSIVRLVDGIYSNTVQNSFDQSRLGLNMSYYNTFFGIWETAINTNASYRNTKPIIAESTTLEVYSFYYSVNNTITLNKKKTYFLALNFWHSLPYTYGNTYLKDQLEFSTGLRTAIFDKSLNANFVVNDIFRTIKNNGYSAYSAYVENFTQYNDHRKFTLSLSYSFGNKKVKSLDKSTKFEEKNRAN